MWPFGKSTKKRLEEALAAYPALEGIDLGVEVDDGTAVISGSVPTERHIKLIEGVARGLNGVDHVDSGGLKATMTVEVAAAEQAAQARGPDVRAIAAALSANPDLADDPIDIWVDGGVVKLRGAVDSTAEHEAAVAAASGAGARQVDAGELRVVQNVRSLVAGSAGGEVLYTVEPGDTLSAIALKYYGSAGRTSYMRIADHNGIDNPDLIRVGQKLVIPGSPDGPDTMLG
jgi:nucleoid-associated protein YgaU